ncbi:hypothetical protein N5J23_18120 [Comamonas aquatica]|uniref:Uncharacterized protein n=1 Tax=Comamonas aquatica TaxID=225991 RepID=A0AA42W4X7_9BURK|nr:hypothetical protein [Comamonas aquatica]MDH0373739.1 hypothetical protein [Comamonas aquatica]MDH1428805.1 hypothetical protein [Comamonas aquatica]MDH1607680.1 hypothetical protein [Comamonas aquatica]MDH1619436.1 hypothetical protein [Comamonas aquatica]MDH2007416.1 hypothetical protein [Comamonas aquatica]
MQQRHSDAPKVPTFMHIAQRKLLDLEDRGYSVVGYAIQKTIDGNHPSRGFIDSYGFVGWWRGEDEWNLTVQREVERRLKGAQKTDSAVQAKENYSSN